MKKILLAAAVLLALGGSARAQLPPMVIYAPDTAHKIKLIGKLVLTGSGLTSCSSTANPGFVTCTFAGGGTGTVTNIATTGPIAGGPITGTGTLSCPTCVTGSPSAVGDILYSTSGGQAQTPLADVAAGSYLRSGGVATAPLWSTLTLPNAATTGDILYATGSNAVGRLADVAVGQVIRSGGVGAAPAWGALQASDVPDLSATYLSLGGGTMTGAITFNGTQLGTYTLGGTPTLGAALGITTDSTNVGGATKRINPFFLTLDSGASTGTLRTTVAAGSTGFNLNHVNGSNDPIAMFQQAGVNQFYIKAFGTHARVGADSGKTALEIVGPSVNNTIIIQDSPTQEIDICQGASCVSATTNHFQPTADTGASGHEALGGASHRFDYAAIGGAVAVQPTCDATTRASTMTIFAANGASDTFQVCMKSSADAYAWRTVFTAP